jgi:membrane associated rhomboid family serine protease
MASVEVDVHPHRQFAAMTALAIAVFVALWVHLLLLEGRADAFLQTHGAVPNRVLALLSWRHPYRLLAAAREVLGSVLLHVHTVSLLTSVIFLLLFGASVEDRVGHYRFLLLVLLGGAIAVLAESFQQPQSRDAIMGARGGVAAVAGACLAIAPRGQVPSMIRGFAFPWILGPAAWLAVTLFLAVAPLATVPGTASLGLPSLLLAYGTGAALGEFYRRHRPILLRG